MVITEKDLSGPKGFARDTIDFSILEPMSIEEENEWTRKLIVNLESMEVAEKPFNPFPPLPTGKRHANR